MQLEFRQRLLSYALILIFMMPNFQYFLAMPGMVGWFSSDTIINSTMIMLIWLVPCFVLMEFFEWRCRKNPEPPRFKISLEMVPAFSRPVFRWLWYSLAGVLLAYVTLGILVVILSTFVLDPPYKFWVWGLTGVVIAIFPWRQAFTSIKESIGHIRSKFRRQGAIDG